MWPDRDLAEGQPRLTLEDLAEPRHLGVERPQPGRTETWADLGPTRLWALDAQVARLGEILEGEPRLTLGEVTVGPHA